MIGRHGKLVASLSRFQALNVPHLVCTSENSSRNFIELGLKLTTIIAIKCRDGIVMGTREHPGDREQDLGLPPNRSGTLLAEVPDPVDEIHTLIFLLSLDQDRFTHTGI